MTEFQRYSCYTVAELQKKAANLKEALIAIPKGTTRHVRHQRELMKVLRAIERKSSEPYTTRTIRFVLSVIQQRKRLVNTKQSHKNEALMREEISRIERQINAWEWKTKTMAGFFLHNAGIIYELIPMPESGETARHRQFHHLKNEALIIKKQEEICYS